MKATIQKVQLRRVDEIWKKHKPQGLGFSDNDAIVVYFKTADGKLFSQTFYCRLKADGTLGHSITKTSEKRQNELRNFIKRYISGDKNYNIHENYIKWEEKEIELEEINGGYIIKA